MDTTHLEERLSHLMLSVDDLSDVVARQQREIALLTRRVAALTEREAEREAGQEVGPADQPPPHW